MRGINTFGQLCQYGINTKSGDLKIHLIKEFQSSIIRMAAPYDPVNFIPADVFFKSFYGSSQNQQPAIATVVSSNSTKPSDPLRYAADIKFQSSSGSTTSETHCLLQFVTPQIWRIRYNPKFNQVTKYPDANTWVIMKAGQHCADLTRRTIVEDKFSTLVDNLQEEFRESEANNGYTDRKDWYWKTQFEQKSSTHWILSVWECIHHFS